MIRKTTIALYLICKMKREKVNKRNRKRRREIEKELRND